MDGKAVDDGQTLSVKIFVPRTERQPGAGSCSNLYVKNFPTSDSGEVYSDADLRKVFESYGPLTSCKVDDSGKFGFVSFEDPAHAAKALDHLGDSDSGSLFVTKMQSKELRAKMLRLEILKSMK
jgi:RNA recognition motif-containing protein